MNKEIYIVLSDTGSLLTRAIKYFTKAPYNHVSIALDDRFDTLYSFGRRKPKNPFIGGFVEESFYEGTFKRFENTQCLVMKLAIDDETYDTLKETIQVFVDNKEHYHYDFLGLLGTLARKRINREKHYYCSEFVGEVMAKSDIYFWDLPPYLLTPDDFRPIDEFEFVYEGLLREYEA